MRHCTCGGDLLRHGVTQYKENKSIIGVRYICRECRKTFTQRGEKVKKQGMLFFSETGRPTINDWRYGK